MTVTRFKYANDRLSTLHGLARELKAAGFPPSTIKDLLIAYDAVWNVPCFGETEVERIVDEAQHA